MSSKKPNRFITTTLFGTFYFWSLEGIVEIGNSNSVIRIPATSWKKFVKVTIDAYINRKKVIKWGIEVNVDDRYVTVSGISGSIKVPTEHFKEWIVTFITHMEKQYNVKKVNSLLG